MELSRRGFFNLMLGAAAAECAKSVIPFGRVWSFPSEIVIPAAPAVEIIPSILPDNHFLTTQWVSEEMLRLFKGKRIAEYFSTDWERAFDA